LVDGHASDSALFDIFHDEGAHRLQIESEASPTLRYWSSSNPGREVSNRYLKLYDGDPWRQTFRKQADKDSGPSKYVDEAVLSLAMGGTPGGCRFNGIDAQSGLRRRFGYYVSEQPARMIYWPEEIESCIEGLVTLLDPITGLEGKVELSKGAMNEWKKIQDANRAESAAVIGSSPADEALRSALAESPSRVLKIAIIFEVCRWAKLSPRRDFNYQIQADTLEIAAKHQAACIEASKVLDTIGKRAELIDEGERILAKIRSENKSDEGVIRMGRTELTNSFANNPGRAGGMTASRLHDEIMPLLINRGYARTGEEGGKKIYFFKAEA
jgi:hypothetical protein